MATRQAALARSAQREHERDVEYARVQAELDEAVRLVATSVLEVGLPMMSQYDLLEKIRMLFEDKVDARKVGVAVLFAEKKLGLLRDH